jgi:hypothetical protein
MKELQIGMDLTKDNPSQAFGFAQQLDATPDVGALPAFEYAVAYQSSGDDHRPIRAQSGRYLFRFVQNARKVDKSTIDRWNGYVQSTQSAGLYAFAALEAHVLGRDDAAGKALEKAVSLDPNLPEVHLIHGILDAAQNNAADAKKEYYAAATAHDAPDWVVNAAKSLAQKGQ